MIMNAEPDNIHVMFITPKDEVAIDTGPREEAFQHFKKVCGVSMVEIVRLGFQNAYMLIDEEALCHSKPLPVNRLATSLINLCCLADGCPTPYLIHGPAMVVGASDEGEIDMDCPRIICGKALLLMKVFGLEEDELEHLIDY